MRQEQINIYKFSELSEDVQKIALDEMRDINTNHDWWEFIYEDFKENNVFEVGEIYFSGFSSQGDGAMFEYSDFNTSAYINSLDLPEWKKEVLRVCQTRAKGKHSGRYYHYNSCSHDCDIDLPGMYNHDNVCKFIGYFAEKLGQHIKDEYKSLCNELYRTLEEEYSYLQSDESVQETIECNEYHFFSNGKFAANL